jgi:hypothetical protein
MLARDYPKWRTCQSNCPHWREAPADSLSLREAALKRLVGAVRHRHGRHQPPRFIIIDAPSGKHTDTAAQQGDEAGKQGSGLKRHLAVNRQGLPPASMSPPPMSLTGRARWQRLR